MFHAPIEARYLRIIPLSWNSNIAARFDIIGCSEQTTTDLIDEIDESKVPKELHSILENDFQNELVKLKLIIETDSEEREDQEYKVLNMLNAITNNSMIPETKKNSLKKSLQDIIQSANTKKEEKNLKGSLNCSLYFLPLSQIHLSNLSL